MNYLKNPIIILSITAIVMALGATYLLKDGYRPQAQWVLKPTGFNQIEEIGSTFFKRYYVDFNQLKLIEIIYDKDQPGFSEFIKGFSIASAKEKLKIDFVIIDANITDNLQLHYDIPQIRVDFKKPRDLMAVHESLMHLHGILISNEAQSVRPSIKFQFLNASRNLQIDNCSDSTNNRCWLWNIKQKLKLSKFTNYKFIAAALQNGALNDLVFILQ